MYYFGFLPLTNENMKKNLKNLHFGKNFLFFLLKLDILYLYKRVLFKNAVNTPKNVEKHVIYNFFQKKKYIVAMFNVFCLLFDENNEISRKSSKN